MNNPILHIIAAACENRGIGSNGRLPWRLKKEMNYFNQKTSTSLNTNKQNAVIMGRKTWLSIPEKHRPLPRRLNVVLTTSPSAVVGAHHVTDSFGGAMEWLHAQEKIDKVFVIGGESVYKTAMDSDYHQIIYLTRIYKNFECDAFFPDVDAEKYCLTEREDVPKEIQEEDGLRYKFEVYEKRQG